MSEIDMKAKRAERFGIPAAEALNQEDLKKIRAQRFGTSDEDKAKAALDKKLEASLDDVIKQQRQQTKAAAKAKATAKKTAIPKKAAAKKTVISPAKKSVAAKKAPAKTKKTSRPAVVSSRGASRPVAAPRKQVRGKQVALAPTKKSSPKSRRLSRRSAIGLVDPSKARK